MPLQKATVEPAARDRARHHDAEDGRADRPPPSPQPGDDRQHPDHPAHRPRAARGPGAGPRVGCRRLHHQAVRHQRAGGPGPGSASRRLRPPATFHRSPGSPATSRSPPRSRQRISSGIATSPSCTATSTTSRPSTTTTGSCGATRSSGSAPVLPGRRGEPRHRRARSWATSAETTSSRSSLPRCPSRSAKK